MSGEVWTEKEQDFLKANYRDFGPRGCAKSLERGYSSVSNKAGKLDLSFWKKPSICDETFFDNWTKESAYCYGLLLSDGFMAVARDKRYRGVGYRVEFETTDEELAEVFVRCIKGKVRRKSRSRKDSFVVAMNGQYVYARLWSLGFCPFKSLNERWPKFPSDKFYWHFLRGYLDGDGCVSCCRGYLRAEFLGGKGFLERLKSFVERFGIETNKLVPRQDRKVLSLAITNKESLKILAIKMYCDSEGLRLSKKCGRFKEYFSNEIL